MIHTYFGIPASTHHENISQTLFQFVVICKVVSTWFTLHRVKQVTVGGCQKWAVSRTGKNGPSQFCDCLTCVQAGVRSGIVVKEKDVFRISVGLGRTIRMRCRSLFKVSLYRTWCAAKSEQGILQHCYIASYSTLEKVYWKLWNLCENNHIIKKICINHPRKCYCYCNYNF
jgi:hypothetical protein